MKIVFMGTPEFALTALKKLAAEHEIVAVYTRAPKPAGRGNKLIKSPVHLGLCSVHFDKKLLLYQIF